MPRNLEVVNSDDIFTTFECVVKTKVNDEMKEDIATFKFYKDLDTLKEYATLEDYESLLEIRKIRAQDAVRRTMQEDDPKKIALKLLKSKLKSMSEDDINALLQSI